MDQRFGKRSWVKLWVNEWLNGTTRFEMTDAQRAFWIDLLAMAGWSRIPGIVCAGQVNGIYVGYPITKFQSLLSEPMDVEATLELFERSGKILIEITQEIPIKLYKITLINWDKYQSEYQRQKKYRKRLQQSDRKSYVEGNKTDPESDTESEINRHPKTRQIAHKSSSLQPPKMTTDDLKKFVLKKAEDQGGVIAAALDIIAERAIASGTEIQSAQYLENALKNFNFVEGKDHDELLRRLR